MKKLVSIGDLNTKTFLIGFDNPEIELNEGDVVCPFNNKRCFVWLKDKLQNNMWSAEYMDEYFTSERHEYLEKGTYWNLVGKITDWEGSSKGKTFTTYAD